MVKLSYETIKETFEKGGCRLLTTLEEFKINNMNSKSKYKIIPQCGHQVDNCLYYTFKNINTGKICISCTNKKKSLYNINLNKGIDGTTYALNIEHISINLFKKI